MAKYRVIPIAMTIKNNGIAEHGNVVDESQLCSPVYDLIKDGFIELVEEETDDSVEEKVSKKASKK
jgi:hypothetical protein